MKPLNEVLKYEQYFINEIKHQLVNQYLLLTSNNPDIHFSPEIREYKT
jgi:hypothetical protein